jgi:diguanylate cyclase (GGDEF)-like protein/PAS domain S-box-containing protein
MIPMSQGKNNHAKKSGNRNYYPDQTKSSSFPLAEAELRQRDELLQILARLATSFVDADLSQLDTFITRALGEVGSFLALDRVYVFQHDYEKRITTNTHEWCAEGIKAEIDNLQSTPFEFFPDILKKQMQGEVVIIPDIDAMPSSDPMKEFLANQDIKSVVMLPTMHGDKCLGFVGFDAVRSKRVFTETEIRMLKILAELLTSTELRRQSDLALQQSQEELISRHTFAEALFKNSSDAIVVFDQHHCILDANQSFLELFTMDLKEIRGRDVDDVLEMGQPASSNRTSTKNMMHGNKVFDQGIRYTRQGIPLAVTIKGIPVMINGQFAGGYAIYSDITTQQEAEEALRKSEEKYKEILSTMQEGYYEVDLKGNLLFCNDSLCHIMGYSREELMKMSYRDYYVNPKELFRVFNKVYRTGQPEKSANWTIITGGGKEKHIEISASLLQDDQGKAIGFRGVGRDVTERKQAEEALRESEEKYRDILASIEDGFFEVDLKGNIVFCNNASASMLGYSVDEFMGMNYSAFCRYPDQVFNAFNKVFRTGKTQHAQTFDMVKKDGSDAYGELSLSLVQDEEGTLVGFRGVGRDVTERKQFEEQLKYLSLHDQLTELYNRSYFENELARLSRSREYPITIISIDLDGLKLVNDTVGHEQGDQLLIACAKTLHDTLRGSDILARIGGDEFVAILPRTDESTAENIIKRIKINIDHYNRKQKYKLPLSVSIGFSTAEDNIKPLQDTFKEADDLMYRDKLHKGVDSRSQIILSLMAALGERDFITEGHARRLEDLCNRVGEKIGLSKKQLSDLVLLAQVHDLGKVGTPDKILFKNGSLTDEEWQIMQQHSEKGYRIAMSSSDLSGIANLILKHHERWDGCGYPLGIGGKEIPIECRILSIADAYDAMTSDRPYRKAMKQEETIAELQKNAGSQFDPELVDIFITILQNKNYCLK